MTRVLPPELDRRYPVVVRGEGVWLEDTAGRRYPTRWQVLSPAQAYHGPPMETLALTGRPGLQGSLGPYLARHLHIPPSTSHFDPSGEAALEALDAALDEAGPENVSAFFCEAI